MAHGTCCVYAHYQPNSKVPFYIGASKNEFYRPYCKYGRNSKWRKAAKSGFIVKILKKGMLWNDALILECKLIIKHHNVLCNGGKMKYTFHSVNNVRNRMNSFKKYNQY